MKAIRSGQGHWVARGGGTFRKPLPHTHCLPKLQGHIGHWPKASCFEVGFRWWRPVLGKGKRWGTVGWYFPEGGQGAGEAKGFSNKKGSFSTRKEEGARGEV